MPKTLTTTEARADFLEIVFEVGQMKQRFRITRRGKTVAAIVSADDLERLESEDTDKDRGEARKMLAGIRSGKEKTVMLAEIGGTDGSGKAGRRSRAR